MDTPDELHAAIAALDAKIRKTQGLLDELQTIRRALSKMGAVV